MKSDIEIIMDYPLDDVVRLILKHMEDWKVSRIRGELEPHWSDGMYGNWSTEDPLLKVVFVPSGYDWVNSRDTYSGDIEREFVNVSECKLCGETLINDERFTSEFYSHLFAKCKIAGKLMKVSKSEDEFREKVSQVIKSSVKNEN